MPKILLLFLFCAISGYGIHGFPNEAAVAANLKLGNTNSNVSDTVVRLPPVSSSSSVSIPSTTVAEPNTSTVVSHVDSSEKQNSASTKPIENTSMSTQTNQSLPKVDESLSKTKADNTAMPTLIAETSTTTVNPSPIISDTPVTTPAPIVPVPAPKAGNWVYNETNQTCIMVNMAVQFNISSMDNINMTHKVFNLPSNATNVTVTGECGKMEQYITLSWNYTLNKISNFTVHFVKNETTKQYSLHHLEVITVDKNKKKVLTHNETLFSTGLDTSYRCLKKQNFTLYENGVNGTVGYFMMADLQFRAFKTDNTKEFGEVKDCKLDTPDIVPIAVGCALATLVGSVLIAYLLARKRSQAHGYLSM